MLCFSVSTKETQEGNIEQLNAQDREITRTLFWAIGLAQDNPYITDNLRRLCVHEFGEQIPWEKLDLVRDQLVKQSEEYLLGGNNPHTDLAAHVREKRKETGVDKSPKQLIADSVDMLWIDKLPKDKAALDAMSPEERDKQVGFYRAQLFYTLLETDFYHVYQQGGRPQREGHGRLKDTPVAFLADPKFSYVARFGIEGAAHPTPLLDSVIKHAGLGEIANRLAERAREFENIETDKKLRRRWHEDDNSNFRKHVYRLEKTIQVYLEAHPEIPREQYEPFDAVIHLAEVDSKEIGFLAAEGLLPNKPKGENIFHKAGKFIKGKR